MLKITVNNINGKSWMATKDTQLEADQWIEKHKKNNTFGLSERKVREDKKPKDLEYKEVPKFKLDENTFELVLDEDGMPVEEGVDYIVTYPCEYEIEIEEVTTTVSVEDAWKELRAKRNELLRNTDYTQLADAPIDSTTKRLYREYRAYLRKLPTSYNDEYIKQYKIETFKEWKNRVHPY